MKELIDQHNAFRQKCFNLVPSENAVSNYVKSAFSGDLGSRYYFSEAFKTDSGISYDYRGSKYIAEIYEKTTKLAQEVFNAKYVNLNMISGHQANINMLMSFCSPGDSIICSNTEFGGYPGLASDKLPRYLGIKVLFFPQKDKGSDIDLDLFKKTLEKEKPKLVMLSSSITIFPFPVREVSELCHKYGIPFCYDASHPLGLIAGKQFQDPFQEGADFIIGSTHKSFPGPQGGIIMGKEEFYPKIKDATDFVTVDNIHVNRVAALGLALEEMKHFGKAYATQIIKNSKALASALDMLGVKVKYKNQGFTSSHQFMLEEIQNYPDFTSKLEKVNIIVDNSGRVGTSEITRFGMLENDMVDLAKIFKMIKDDVSLDQILKQSLALRGKFPNIKFVFE